MENLAIQGSFPLKQLEKEKRARTGSIWVTFYAVDKAKEARDTKRSFRTKLTSQKDASKQDKRKNVNCHQKKGKEEK